MQEMQTNLELQCTAMYDSSWTFAVVAHMSLLPDALYEIIYLIKISNSI